MPWVKQDTMSVSVDYTYCVMMIHHSLERCGVNVRVGGIRPVQGVQHGAGLPVLEVQQLVHQATDLKYSRVSSICIALGQNKDTVCLDNCYVLKENINADKNNYFKTFCFNIDLSFNRYRATILHLQKSSTVLNASLTV